MLDKPKSLAEAREYVGRRVVKHFQTGPFAGIVEEALGEYQTHEGEVVHAEDTGFLYHIKYEDGDEEDIDFAELTACLVVSPQPAPGRKKHSGGQGGSSTMPRSQKRQHGNESRGFHEGSPLEDSTMQENAQVQPSVKRSRTIATQQLGELDANTMHQGPNALEGRAAGHKVLGRNAQHAQRNQQETARGSLQEPAPMAVDNAEQDNDITACRSKGLAGHLKRIMLQDFMCHAHFTMEFGPHVTMVSGTNGSGKSAVMQGLQACLGVSARETGRSKSLGAFVREGTDVAVVQVTLWNEGADTYMPQLFGREIMIERRIRRAGGCDFKLFGEHRLSRGTAISTKREDVYAVLDHFNINAANPLTIITQDMARTFLHGSANSSRFRYDMYMEGTMLAEIKEYMTRSYDSIRQADRNLNITEEAQKRQKEEVERLQQELERLRSVKLSQQLAAKLGKVAVWRVYQEARHETLTKQQQHADLQQKLEEAGAALPAMKEKVQQAQASIQAKQGDLNHAMEETRNLQAVLKQLQAELKIKQTACRNAEQLHKQTQAELDRLQQDKSGLEEQLTQVANSSQDTARVAEAKRRLAELDQQTKALAADIEEQDQRFNAKRAAKDEVVTAIEALQQEIRGVQQQAHSVNKEINEYLGQIRATQSSANSKVAAFGGQQMVQLVNLLQQPQNRRHFRHIPIGPIGAYLGLTETRWSRAVESLLGGEAERFLCSCEEDNEQLRRLAKQVKIHINTAKVRFGLPRHQVQRRYNTERNISMLDVLSIMHPDAAACNVIFNALVDTSRIDTVLLLESSAACKEIREQPGFGSTGFTLMDPDGRKYRTINGTKKIDPPPYRSYNRIGLDTSEQIRQLKEMVAQRQSNLQELQQQVMQLNAQLEDKKRTDALLYKEGADIHLYKLSLRRKMHDLQQQNDLMLPVVGQQMGEEEAQMQYATQAIGQVQVDITATQVELRENENALQAAQREAQQARAKYEAKRHGPSADLGRLNQEIEVLSAQEAAATVALSERQKLCQMLEAQLQQRQAEILQSQKDEEDSLSMVAEEFDGASDLESRACQVEEEVKKHFVEKFLSDPKAAARRSTRRTDGGRQQGHAGPSQMQQHAHATQAGALKSELEQYLDTMMQAQALLHEMERLEKLANEARKQAGGDEHVIECELDKVRAQYEKRNAKLVRVKAQVRQLSSSYNARLTSFGNLKQNISDTSHAQFNKYMQRRLHLGKLEVDERNMELNVRVKVKGKEDPKAQWVSDLKQLSGGERSYTAVALLLALGKWSESPFRCLDEYDVFMDAINRRIATETLLSFALEMKDRQYVLLTPQDLSAIQDANKQLQQKLSHQLGTSTKLPASFLHMVHIKPARPDQH